MNHNKQKISLLCPSQTSKFTQYLLLCFEGLLWWKMAANLRGEVLLKHVTWTLKWIYAERKQTGKKNMVWHTKYIYFFILLFLWIYMLELSWKHQDMWIQLYCYSRLYIEGMMPTRCLLSETVGRPSDRERSPPCSPPKSWLLTPRTPWSCSAIIFIKFLYIDKH